MKIYIYQKEGWPHFTWDTDGIVVLLGEVRYLQGRLIGKMIELGFDQQNEASLSTLTLEIVKSNEIEGEILNPNQVRSSIARKLGLDIGGLVASDRHIDGVVDMMLDATKNYQKKITAERLFGWHAALFPTGYSGMYKIKVGGWREDTTGPMQVISGAMGKRKIHFEAPASEKLVHEMEILLNWVNKEERLDPILKAGVAHFWFVTIHPFEDGNGRIARGLTELLLARADGLSERYYSMSAQIRKERKSYYEILEKSQKGKVDITAWLTWFLTCLKNALESSEDLLEVVLFKHRYWNQHSGKVLNARQIKLLNRLLDGFTGKLTSKKWAKIGKCSADTALRDITDLIEKGMLERSLSGGRSTSYEIAKLIS